MISAARSAAVVDRELRVVALLLSLAVRANDPRVGVGEVHESRRCGRKLERDDLAWRHPAGAVGGDSAGPPCRVSGVGLVLVSVATCSGPTVDVGGQIRPSFPGGVIRSRGVLNLRRGG